MKTFIMSSPAFTGEVRFEFDQTTGQLRELSVPDGFGTPQHVFLFKYLPATLVLMQHLQAWLKEIKSPAMITEVVQEVTFDEFWKRYFAGRGCDNSSKKKALARWNRMSKCEQLRAYNHVNRYLNRIQPGVGVKLAETYLNSEIWNN